MLVWLDFDSLWFFVVGWFLGRPPGGKMSEMSETSIDMLDNKADFRIFWLP